MSNGKGDSPRNCFSKKFKDNYDFINWGRAKTIDELCGSPKGTFKKFIEEQSESESYKNSKLKPRYMNCCVFCKRDVVTRGHHIVPRCKGGKQVVDACESCEDFIHSTWTHNELRDIYNNVDTIVNNEKFSKFLKWLLKQPKDTVFKSSISNTRTHKGRYK